MMAAEPTWPMSLMRVLRFISPAPDQPRLDLLHFCLVGLPGGSRWIWHYNEGKY